MIKKREKGGVWKLTTELFLIMLVSAVAAVGCMLWLYNYRFTFYGWTVDKGLVSDNREAYKEWFLEQAKNYELKPLAADEVGREAYDKENLPFLQERWDRYTGVMIYEKSTGSFVTGYFPMLLDNAFWGSWIWSDADIFSQTQIPLVFDAEFLDCTAEVHLSTYMIMQVIPLYLLVGIILCVAIFLIPVLVFVHRKMAYLGKVRREVLVMAEGDLHHPVTVRGKDELGALAGELDSLRLALAENIEKERQSHQANQELIRALSHDLRTPLTTLNGYLEILNHSKGDSERYPEYLRRCLSKTQEIRGMSDKMFEYALVFDGQENVEKQPLELAELWSEWEALAEDLRVQGFVVQVTKERPEGEISGNAFLLKRLAENLFSNIQRYADKGSPIIIEAKVSGDRAEFCMKNRVSGKREAAGSGVGLKSAARIAALHDGSFVWEEKEKDFRVAFSLPLCGQAVRLPEE